MSIRGGLRGFIDKMKSIILTICGFNFLVIINILIDSGPFEVDRIVFEVEGAFYLATPILVAVFR
jgi:hypothetical protein